MKTVLLVCLLGIGVARGDDEKLRRTAVDAKLKIARRGMGAASTRRR